MSTIALRIIQLIKSLPPEEQRAVYTALNRVVPASNCASPTVQPTVRREVFEGLSDTDPLFDILDRIEQERHLHPGRPAPSLD